MLTMLRTHKKNIFLSIVLVVLSSYIATRLLLNSQNVLFNNDFWIPYKTQFHGLLGNGIETLVDRSKIAGEKLRDYHNRVFSKQSITPVSIRFKAVLKNPSFIDVIYNGDDEKFDAIRIATTSVRESFQYQSTHTGKYLWKKKQNTKVGEFGIFFVKLSEENGKLVLSLNNEKHILDGSMNQGKIGFDLGEKSFIWDVDVKTKDGTEISAPFETTDQTMPFFFKNLGIIVLLVLVASLIFKSFLRPAFFFFLFFVISYSFDYFYYSRLLFRFSPLDFTFLQPYKVMKYDPETIRFKVFKKWYNFLGGKTPLENDSLKKQLWTLGPFRTRHCVDNQCTTYAGNKYPYLKPRSENSLRFLLWGGSLSAGTTLNNLEQSYPDVIYRRLQAMFPDKKVELMNTSRGEVDFRNFHDITMDNGHFFPDYFLIDAFVIKNHQEFEDTIKTLATFKSKKVLLKPPINAELFDQKDLDHVREKIAGGLSDNPEYYYQLRLDPFIKRWQEQYDLSYIDGNLKLLSPEVDENGQLFWDMVHLTAYGHEVWGEYLAENLAEMIKKRAP